MSEISGPGGIDPSKQQASMGIVTNIDTFQQTLSAFSQSGSADIKVEQKEVMDKMMTVIRDAINKMGNSEVASVGQKVETDYKSFVTTPTTDSADQLQKDLTALKDAVTE